MATIKAAPTVDLIQEYFNAGLMTTAATTTGLVFYVLMFDGSVSLPAVGAWVAASWSAPATALALRSFGRLLDMTPRRRQPAPIAIGLMDGPMSIPGNEGISYTANGRTTFLSSVSFLKGINWAFDPTVRGSDDITTRNVKYKEDRPRQLHWRIDVSPRTDRNPVTVILYQDLVEDIIEKAWRQQERLNAPHPLSQDKILSLHFSCRGGRRLLLPEYLAFMELGTKYQFIVGRRQGSSGKLGGTPQWCRRRIGLPH